MSHTPYVPAKAAGEATSHPLRVAAQIEAYDWLAYAWDLSHPVSRDLPVSGIRYFARLYFQLDR